MRTFLWTAIKTLAAFLILSGVFLAGRLSQRIGPWASLEPLEPALLSPGNGQEPGAETIPNLELYRQVWQLLERDFYGEAPDPTQRTYGAIQGLVAAYNDPYTVFVEPQPRELERDQLEGSFGGIGAWIDQEEGQFRLRPMPGQPAEQAGLLAGDRILRVDETPVTPEMDMEALLALLHGPVGSEVCLTVERMVEGTPQERTVCVTRAEIETPSVEWRILERTGPTKVGYIKQSFFSKRSPEEMRRAIQELQAQGAQRFVLDLRGNPGGLVSSAIEIASLWLKDGVVLVEERADGARQEFTATGDPLLPEAPLVVLVDGGSASASEIVAGALRDRGRALLVGERTFGKGSVQLVHELPDKSSLHVTNARWFTPKDQAIDGVGLEPDVPVTGEEDPLDRAVATLLEMKGPTETATRLR